MPTFDATPRLGRVRVADPRDAGYPMALRLDATPPPPWAFWRPALPCSDQGPAPTCTAWAWFDWERCAPGRVLTGLDDPNSFYAAEQAIDGIPGVHDGSTVRAGAAILRREGRIGSYLWAREPAELRRWVLTRGSVVVGSDWREGMVDVDRAGLIHATGRVLGGHAYLVIGLSSSGHYRIQNSWGPRWGDHGMAWIAAAELEGLVFGADGEACAAIELRPQ